MHAVESEALKKVGYDADTRTMRVQFEHGGVYEASDIPPEKHADLMAAEHKGKHFVLNLRHRYQWNRVE